MKPYPESAPVFEVIVPDAPDGHGGLIARGYVFDACPWNVEKFRMTGGDRWSYPIADASCTHRIFTVDEVKPLTRAARAMLALVK